MLDRIIAVVAATTHPAVNAEGVMMPAEPPQAAAMRAVLTVLIAVAALVIFFKYLDRPKPPHGGQGGEP